MIINEKKICQLIDKVKKSLFANRPMLSLSCKFDGHDDVVAIYEALLMARDLVQYGIVEFDDEGYELKNIDLEKYEFDDKGVMKLPELSEVSDGTEENN